LKMTAMNMFTYTLNGRVLPERANVSISGIKFGVKVPAISSDWLNISISILLSQISVIVKSQEKIADFLTLRNYVQDMVALVVDIYGYLSGRGYDVEIVSLTTEDNTPHVIFGVGISELEAQEKERPFTYEDIVKLLKGNADIEQQLRLALINFRLAIRNASDTGFHCYRALEAMKQPFGTWEKFNSELDIDNSWLMEMKNKHANKQRHGESTFMSGKDRTKMLENTQKVIDKFILWYQKTIPSIEG